MTWHSASHKEAVRRGLNRGRLSLRWNGAQFLSLVDTLTLQKYVNAIIAIMLQAQRVEGLPLPSIGRLVCGICGFKLFLFRDNLDKLLSWASGYAVVETAFLARWWRNCFIQIVRCAWRAGFVLLLNLSGCTSGSWNVCLELQKHFEQSPMNNWNCHKLGMEKKVDLNLLINLVEICSRLSRISDSHLLNKNKLSCPLKYIAEIKKAWSNRSGF